MTATVPRAELNAVMDRYGAHWPAQGDAPAPVIRDAVAVIRKETDCIVSTKFEDVLRRDQLAKLADDLDALADRYEQEARR